MFQRYAFESIWVSSPPFKLFLPAEVYISRDLSREALNKDDALCSESYSRRDELLFSESNHKKRLRICRNNG